MKSHWSIIDVFKSNDRKVFPSYDCITFYCILGKENQLPDKYQHLKQCSVVVEQCTDIPLASTVAGNLFIIESF